MSTTLGFRRIRRTTALLVAALASAVPTAVVVTQSSVSAATFTVTSLSDDGSSGTLRWAITQANAAAGDDTIDFDPSVSGTITLTSSLPGITDTVTITGPGQDNLTIDGVGSYRPFTFSFGGNSGKTLTVTDMTLRRGGGGGEAQLIFNSRGTVVATRVTFKDTTGTAVFNKEAWSVATYTDCTFQDNGTGIGGDHGSTPSAVSNTDSDYQNRTYVVNSLFQRNTNGINQQRFTRITNSTFKNNNTGASISGLNRTQIYNSLFENNSTAVYHTNWTPTTWTSVGTNNRLHDGNTFRNNGKAFGLTDGWNDGKKSQQWTTITNNIWDGVNTWIVADRWDVAANVRDTVNSVNSSGREWVESGNTIVSPTTTTTTTTTTSTTTTTTVAPTTVAPTSTIAQSTSTTAAPTTTAAVATATSTTGPTTTLAPSVTTTTVATVLAEASNGASGAPATSAPASLLASTVTTTARVTAPTVDPAVAAAASTSTTTVPQTTTTTTVPAPDAPQVEPGQAGATIDGESVEAQISRRDNALVLGLGAMSASIHGETTDGERIALDVDGNLSLAPGDRVIVSGQGFESQSDVDVWLFSTPTRLGAATSSTTGTIQGSFIVPEAIESGSHRLILDGRSADGKPAVIGVGLLIGGYDTEQGINKWLIIVPIVLATTLGLVIPTTLQRRRKREAGA